MRVRALGALAALALPRRLRVRRRPTPAELDAALRQRRGSGALRTARRGAAAAALHGGRDARRRRAENRTAARRPGDVPRCGEHHRRANVRRVGLHRGSRGGRAVRNGWRSHRVLDRARRGGGEFRVPSEPVLAPGHQRFATADFCADACDNELAVWRIDAQRRSQGAGVEAGGDVERRRRRVEGRRGAGASNTRSRPAARRSSAGSTTSWTRAVVALARSRRPTIAERRRRRAVADELARSAASCCARAACRPRSSARAKSCCRATAFRAARRSTGTPCSAARRRSCWKSASAWARRPRRSRRRSRDIDFIGVEVHLPGVGALLRRIDDAKLTNVRIVRARCGRRRRDDRARLARRHPRLFPDPWPKKRHHKRRLLQPAFVHELALRLAPRRLPARRHRLGSLTRTRSSRVLAAEPLLAQHRRRLRAAAGVAAADQVRAARHRARPRGVRPAVHAASGVRYADARPRSASTRSPSDGFRGSPSSPRNAARATSREKWRSMFFAPARRKPLPQRLVVVGAHDGFGERARRRRRPARRHRRSGACLRSTPTLRRRATRGSSRD